MERHVWNVAADLHLTKEWRSSQELISETKAREQEEVSLAIQRYQKPSVDLQE